MNDEHNTCIHHHHTMSFEWNLSSEEEGNDEQELQRWATSSGTKNYTLQPEQASSFVAAPSFAESLAGEDRKPAALVKAAPVVPMDQHAFGYKSNEEEENDSDDEEDVIWEDGDDGMEEVIHHNDADTDKPKLRPIVVNLSPSEATKDDKKKKRRLPNRRKSYRYEQLPPPLQQLVKDLSRTHLLAWTSHTIGVSQYCSQRDPLHMAHSLIPLAWMKVVITKNSSGEERQSSHRPWVAPTKDELSHFCTFFTNLIKQRGPGPTNQNETNPVKRGTKRPSRGRSNKRDHSHHHADDMEQLSAENSTPISYRLPEVCAFLSSRSTTMNHTKEEKSHDDLRGLMKNLNEYDILQLFIAMTRSLGWRVRFVTVLDPVLSQDLTEETHPIFVATMAQQRQESLRHFLHRVYKEKKQCCAASAATTTPSQSQIPTALSKDGEHGVSVCCWAEVLCSCPNNNNKKEGEKTNTKSKGGATQGQSTGHSWTHVDPNRELLDRPQIVEQLVYNAQRGIHMRRLTQTTKRQPIAYCLAAEHAPLLFGSTTAASSNNHVRLTDVTPRYAKSWVESLKSRGVIRGKQTQLPEQDRPDLWWTGVLKAMSARNRRSGDAASSAAGNGTEQKALARRRDDNLDDDMEDCEHHSLKKQKQSEPLPTSKTAFKSHPVYVVPSLLKVNEVLKPDAKQRVCGVFKGELVFRRADVEELQTARKWLYQRKKVKALEMDKPIKRIKGRKKPESKGFKSLQSYGVGITNDGTEQTREKILEEASKPLEDGLVDVYASWQTDPWSPPHVGPGDVIPVNEHKNIELELLNPGLVHFDKRGVAKMAKQLGIPYAPCLLGFEGHGGNCTPTIRGIVVHECNLSILEEAHVEVASHLIQKEHEEHKKKVLLRWKRLLVGVLTKDRLEREYGD